MPQRPLHQVEVPGLPIEPRRERVPQGVDREGAGDARLAQPPGEVQLDLPGAEATAGLGAENGRIRGCVALCRAFTEVLAQQAHTTADYGTQSTTPTKSYRIEPEMESSTHCHSDRLQGLTTKSKFLLSNVSSDFAERMVTVPV